MEHVIFRVYIYTCTHLITAKTRSFEFEGVTGEVYNGFKREELKGRNVIKYKLENKKKV